MSISPLYTEKELLAQASEGNGEAFEQLYLRYRNKTLSVTLTFIKSYAEAEDILQDILTQLWSGRKNLGQIESFGDYLFITTRNAIRKSLLKKEKQQKLLNRQSAEQQPQPFGLEGVKDIEKLVNAALLQLPEQQRAIYQMSRQQGLTHEQIGSRLGLSPKTIANNLTLTLNQIRLFLGRQGYLFGAAWLFFNFL